MTKEEKIREIFYRFLKKRKAYQKYMRNLKDKKCGGAGTVKAGEHYLFIGNSFRWGATPEDCIFLV